MIQKKGSAAFRIKEGRNLIVEDTKLSGYSGVVDADKVKDIRTTRLDANTAAEDQRWWVKFSLAILAAVIAAVTGGIILHHGFGIG